MVINRSVLTDAAKGFNAIFQAQWDKLGPKVEPIEQIAMRVPSTGPSETYDWVSDWPQLREWVGPRVVKSLAAHGYTVLNKKWEATVGVKAEDIEDDRLGVYRPKIQMLGMARNAYAKLLTEVLEAGFAATKGLCYDGQYFFDNDHPMAASVGNNVASAALDTTTFWVGRVAMGQYTDDEGHPLGIVPDVCMVGPAKEKVARGLFEAPFLAGGATNTDAGLCKVVVNPWITGYHWFLFDTSKGISPLILQIRKEMIFQMLIGSLESDVEGMEQLDSQVFLMDEYLFGIRARHNAGFGLWQLAYGSNASS